MKHFFVRPTVPADAERFYQWSAGTTGNLFDPDVMTYSTSFCLAAYDKNGVGMYLPVQQPFFMDSLAYRPGLGAVDAAVALKELTKALITQAHIKGVGEIYFVCRDDATTEYALRQGFEEMPYRICRMKIKNLEGNNENIPSPQTPNCPLPE